MIAKMALARDSDQLHVSWAPDREQRTGVAASYIIGCYKISNKIIALLVNILSEIFFLQ